MHGVGGDRMARSWRDMNQGARTGKGTAFMVERPEELGPVGDRAPVGAKKGGNGRGVKGGRKVETMNKAKKIRNTTNVLRTQSGESATQELSFKALVNVCWPPR